MTLEEMQEFLGSLGVENELVNHDEYGFSRTMEFTVNLVVYQIIWFFNNSTLKIGIGGRKPQIPFRYIYHDTTFPLVGGNRAIGFYYEKKEKRHPYDSGTPYFSFRIPLEPPTDKQ